MKYPLDKKIAEIYEKITASDIKLTKETHGELLTDLIDSVRGIIDYPTITSFALLTAVETAEINTSTKISITIGGIIRIYELTESSKETSEPYYIRPTDWAESTNEKVWQLSGCKYIEFIADEVMDGVFTATHNLAVQYVNVQVIDDSDEQVTPTTIAFTDENEVNITVGEISGTYKCIIRC